MACFLHDFWQFGQSFGDIPYKYDKIASCNSETSARERIKSENSSK